MTSSDLTKLILPGQPLLVLGYRNKRFLKIRNAITSMESSFKVREVGGCSIQQLSDSRKAKYDILFIHSIGDLKFKNFPYQDIYERMILHFMRNKSKMVVITGNDCSSYKLRKAARNVIEF